MSADVKSLEDECCEKACCKSAEEPSCQKGESGSNDLESFKASPKIENPRFTRPTLLRLALLITFLTILHNVMEGIISIFFGSENSSVSLLFFGIDSFVEVLSAILVAWRFLPEFTGHEARELERERIGTLVIGMLMCFLSLGTAIASIFSLVRHESPETTLPGLIISTAVILIMLTFYLTKKYLAYTLDSSIMRSDAGCSLACLQLSGVLFIGSLIYKVAPQAWWVDSGAALILAVLFMKEGVEMITYARRKDFAGGCGCAK